MDSSNCLDSEPSVKNKLDFPVDAYIKLDDDSRRGIGKPNEKSNKYPSRVPAKGCRSIHLTNRNFSKIVLIIEMNYMPRFKGKRAVSGLNETLA